MECSKVCSGVRKVKKKHVKDELDRFKQAEKKKRRLEKALATSAAIRTELEKKKLKKQEEQQRLDEEGAAIAEAVALQVLLGEDLDDSSNVMLKKDEGFEPWDFASKFDLLTGGAQSYLPHQDLSRQSAEEIERVSNNHRSGYMWNGWREQGYCSQYPETSVRGLNPLYSYEKGWGTADMSAAAVIAEQAISSLRIAEDEHVDTFMFNQMLRG